MEEDSDEKVHENKESIEEKVYDSMMESMKSMESIKERLPKRLRPSVSPFVKPTSSIFVFPTSSIPVTFKKVIVESYRNLQNYGNTCFFSAGMQAFLHLSPIKIYLMQNQFETSSFTALRNFYKYISKDCELIQTNDGYDQVTKLLDESQMIGESRNGWAYKRQQDCFEFLEKFLYKLNEDIWRLTNKSVTYDTLKNKLTAFNLLWNLNVNEQISCGDEQHDRINVINDHTLQIGLPVKKQSYS